MTRVLVLNADYSILNVTTWQRAVTLLISERAEVVANTDRIIHNFDKSFSIAIPKIIRILKYIRQIFGTRVPYTKQNILTRDNHTCQYCPSKERLTIDHVIPQSKGGKSTWENCVASCYNCNNKKNDRTLREANMFLRRAAYKPTIKEFIDIKMKQLGFDKVLEEILNGLM